MVNVVCVLMMMLPNGKTTYGKVQGRAIATSGDYWTVDFGAYASKHKRRSIGTQVKHINANACLKQ